MREEIEQKRKMIAKTKTKDNVPVEIKGAEVLDEYDPKVQAKVYEKVGWGNAKQEEDKKDEKPIFIVGDANAQIMISAKDQELIDKRREEDEKRAQEIELEYQKNYDEYQ